MPHRNAPLTETRRLRLARCALSRMADRCAGRPSGSRSRPRPRPGWAARYRQPGPAGMGDRSCRPRHCPGSVTAAHRAADHRAARVEASGPGPDRIRAGVTSLHRAPGAEPGTGARGWRAWTGHPACRSAGMSVTTRASWSTSTSRSPATSPMAGALMAGRSASSTAVPARLYAIRHWATATCIPSSTITPGWPTPRSWPMSGHRRPPRSCTARMPGMPRTASSSSVCSATTALLSVRGLGSGLRPAAHHPQAHPALPALTWQHYPLLGARNVASTSLTIPCLFALTPLIHPPARAASVCQGAFDVMLACLRSPPRRTSHCPCETNPGEPELRSAPTAASP
jgi:hypothetical protein